MGAVAGRSVAVVGGGIGGLTAALAFARRGATVTVHEQAEALTEVGAGIQITPNGAVVLEALGLGPGLAARGLAAAAVVPMDALSGREIARFDLTGHSYCFLHRADLIDLLAGACAEAGVSVRLGSRPESVADLPGGADLIVAADGIHSRFRAVLNGEEAPFFTGQVAWRAMVAADQPQEARVWMAPGRHIVTYPLTGGRLNIVAVQERSAFAASGWHHPDEPGNLRHVFRDACPELRGVLARVETTNLWGLFRTVVAPRWQDGRLALVGDAAHPTLPFLAQGANLAIEDAYVLARVCDEDRDRGAALARYQAARAPRVARAIAAANANARNYHLRGGARRVAHLGLAMLGRVAPERFLGRLDWLYGHDVTAGSV